MLKSLISLFSIAPKCNSLCAKHNHVLKRWHASCFWCSTRKSLFNPKYRFNAQFYAFLPAKFDARTAVLNNGTGYIIYTDDARFMRCAKDALLDLIFLYAETFKYSNIAKRLYLICEFLST